MQSLFPGTQKLNPGCKRQRRKTNNLLEFSALLTDCSYLTSLTLAWGSGISQNIESHHGLWLRWCVAALTLYVSSTRSIRLGEPPPVSLLFWSKGGLVNCLGSYRIGYSWLWSALISMRGLKELDVGLPCGRFILVQRNVCMLLSCL